MQAYRVETTLQQDGTLTLSNLPLRAGEAVEVIILVQPPVAVDRQRYPLRGVPVRVSGNYAALLTEPIEIRA